MTDKEDKPTQTRDEKRTEQHQAAGLKRFISSHWVIEKEHPEATEAVNRALKPYKDRARRQLAKWKDEQEK